MKNLKFFVVIVLAMFFSLPGCELLQSMLGDYQDEILMETMDIQENQVGIVFDFSGTHDPDDNEVVPFIFGNISSYISGAGDWGWQGLNADGTGQQVLSKIPMTNLYYIVLTMPDTNAHTIMFQAANYKKEKYTQLTNDFWNNIGRQDPITNENVMVYNFEIQSNKSVLGHVIDNESGSAHGSEIIENKILIIDVGEHGGWTIAGLSNINTNNNVTNSIESNTNVNDNIQTNTNSISTNTYQLSPQTITLIWTNIPSVVLSVRSHTNIYSNWYYPYDTKLSNDQGTNSLKLVVVGSSTMLHEDGVSTWMPDQGYPVNLDQTTKSASVTFDNNSNYSRQIAYKLANELGWSYCIEYSNHSLLISNDGSSHLTNITGHSLEYEYDGYVQKIMTQ